MKDDRFYLIHVAECISKVEEYVASGHDSFMDTPMIQDAVLRNLQIMGESTGRISVQTRVWELIELNLPALENQVEAILRDLEAPS